MGILYIFGIIKLGDNTAIFSHYDIYNLRIFKFFNKNSKIDSLYPTSPAQAAADIRLIISVKSYSPATATSPPLDGFPSAPPLADNLLLRSSPRIKAYIRLQLGPLPCAS